MKKNGFTLVELIATLGLIAILATIILINMTGIKSNQDEVSTSRFKSTVEEAACSYVDLTDFSDCRGKCMESCHSADEECIVSDDEDNICNKCKISLKTLIDRNMVDPNKKDIETGFTAEGEQDKVYVKVYWEVESVSNRTFYKKKCIFKRVNG